MNYITVLYALGAVGVANTLYLSYHTITKKPVWCFLYPEEWCRKVQYSTWSRTFGIPNTFAGLGMYTAILVLTYLYAHGSIAFAPLQYLIWFGFAFSIYFFIIQMFVLRAFCTWCVLSAVDFTLLFIVTLKIIG